MEDPYLCNHIHILKHHSLTLPEFRSITDEDKNKNLITNRICIFSLFQDFFFLLQIAFPPPHPEEQPQRKWTSYMHMLLKICHSGERSLQMVELHQHQGLARLNHMAGFTREKLQQQPQQKHLVMTQPCPPPPPPPPPPMCTTSKTQCRNADKNVAKRHEHMTILWRKR